jgi:hypothetical protein
MRNPLELDLGDIGRYEAIRRPDGESIEIVSLDGKDVSRLGEKLPDLALILETEERRMQVNSNPVKTIANSVFNTGVAITSVIGTYYVLRQVYNLLF